MKPIPNWENITPIAGDFERLPAGGYECRIINAGTRQSRSGKDMLVLLVDIDSGNHANYFTDDYENRARYYASAPDKVRWGAGGMYYNLLEGERPQGMFKGLIETLEADNPQFKWANCNWDEKRLIGCKFGGLFREEEYTKQDGTIGTSVRIFRILPLKGITEHAIPEPKKLTQNANGGGNAATNNPAFGAPMRDEDIPF